MPERLASAAPLLFNFFFRFRAFRVFRGQIQSLQDRTMPRIFGNIETLCFPPCKKPYRWCVDITADLIEAINQSWGREVPLSPTYHIYSH